MYANEMLGVHDTVFILYLFSFVKSCTGIFFTNLTSCVYNLGGVFLSFVFESLGEGILDGWIIAVAKLALNELEGQ